MKKRKFLSLALTVALAATMGTTSFAFADTAANTTTTATKTATDVVSTEKATDIVTDLGMFSPAKGSTKVEIDKLTGKAKVTFTTTPLARKYTKLALVEQSKTAKTKEKHAVSAVVTPVSVDGVEKYVSTFTVEISAADLGKALPISMYQVFTKASGEKIDGWYSFEAQHYLTVKFTPELVTNLTGAIYYQERTAGTDVLCEAAGRGWNTLTDAEQKQVTGFAYYLEEGEEKGGYEYFAEDTGDASKDDPLNADEIGDNELLVVSFGTSFNDSRAEDIGGVEKALQAAYPDWSVRRAFTAQIIINHVQARDDEKIDNVDQALERAVSNGVKKLIIQPTHLMHGAEYDELKEAVDSYKDKFESVTIAEPLLGEVGSDATVINEDKQAVAEAITAQAVKSANYDSLDAAAEDGTAFVFMGHGTSHNAKVTYSQMQTQMDTLGYKNVFIGTVEGEPEETACENVIEAVKAAGYKKVILRPLMVVAGDHANNDMAGEDEDSWKSQFEASGAFDEINTQIEGLGRIDAVEQLYVQHTKAAMDGNGVQDDAE